MSLAPDPSLDRWLLVNYAGYPFAPNSLMPDNGLANMAGALVACRKEVEILDYCTVETIRRMTSPELRERLSRGWATLRKQGRGPILALRQLTTLLSLQRCEKERRRLREEAVEAIGAELAAHVRRKGVQAVGFKLWNGDGLEGAGALAARLRRQFPGLRIFGGGPHVDLFLDRILRRHPVFDALVYGEGEDTILRLAEQGNDRAAYGSIPNLIYMDGAAVRTTPERMVEDLDRLPIPTYDPAVYPAMAGDEKVKIIVIDESRGCRNECAFCAHPVKSHRHVRLKSIARLLREIADLDTRYGFRTFRFAGSCTPYALLNDFAADVIRLKIPLRYASFAHIRGSEEAHFDALRASGCGALFFGIESGSQRVLDGMRKHITVAQTREAVGRCRAAGIFAVGSLISPAPGEDAASEAETLTLIKDLHLDSVMLQAPIVAPRTPWFDTPAGYGIEFDDREQYLDAAMKWKVKLQLPPRFWDTLPIRIGGRGYRKVLAAAGEFGRRIWKMGIPTSISDETYLMSEAAGMAPTRFRDEALAAFYAGDTAAIETLVSRINAGAVSR